MPTRRTKKKTSKSTKKKPRPKHRSSWRGMLSIGLVSFPVEAFNAMNRDESDIHFNQLHASCLRRIHYQKVCPVHGEVSNDEIVSGYEISKGHYIEIDPDEIDALRTDAERALTIDAFISPDTIDPIYFDGRMYYLVPTTTAAETSYQVILTAMEREGVCGVGHVIFSGKEQIAMVRVVDQILHMALLNYEAEIRPGKDIYEAEVSIRGQTRQIQLAQTLIREWSVDDFDFSQYEDTYREKLKKLIDAKAKGQELPEPEETEEEPATINLMEALKNSLGQRKTTGRKSSKKRSSA